MYTVYALELENYRFYIGRTKTQEFDVNTILDRPNIEWTIKNKPLRVMEIIKNCDELEENKCVIKYMNFYGIDFVRGGSFSDMILSDNTITYIVNVIMGSNYNCYRCREKGHIMKFCPHEMSKSDTKETEIILDVERSEMTEDKKTLIEENKKKIYPKYRKKYNTFYTPDENNTEEDNKLNVKYYTDLMTKDMNCQCNIM